MCIEYTFDSTIAKSKIGIYRITIGEHCYIGSTKRSIWTRVEEHRRALQKGNHPNTKMQHAFVEEEQMVVYLLDYSTTENICKKEQYYIDLYKPDLNIVKHVARY